MGELVLCLHEKKKNKLALKWEGAFIIDDILTGGAYRVRNAPTIVLTKPLECSSS